MTQHIVPTFLEKNGRKPTGGVFIADFSLHQVLNNVESQFSLIAQSCPTLCDPMDCSRPGFPVHHHLPELAQTLSIKSVMPSSHLILCPPLLLPSIFPRIRVFSNESALRIRWPNYWRFSFSISPSHEYPGLISFRMDWLDLLEVQGTLKSLLQDHSSKASILCHSAFFIVQISHPCMTTGKTIAWTIWTFVGKVMSLLFNTLSKPLLFNTLSKLVNRFASKECLLTTRPQMLTMTLLTSTRKQDLSFGSQMGTEVNSSLEPRATCEDLSSP